MSKLYAEHIDKESLVDLKFRINSFKKTNLKDLSYEQVQKRMGAIMHGYGTGYAIMSFNCPFFRARKNEPNATYNNISDLWYRTTNVTEIEMGRLNKTGESLFYITNAPNAAVFEIMPKIGDVVTVMEIKHKDIWQINIIPIGMSKSASPLYPIEFNQKRINRHSNMMNDKKWLAKDKFLEDLITETIDNDNKHKYKATSAYAELLFKFPDINAIQYPGIATSLKSLNICMQPDNADRIFKPVRLTMTEIVATRNDPKYGFQYGCKNIAFSDKIDADGKINWESL